MRFLQRVCALVLGLVLLSLAACGPGDKESESAGSVPVITTQPASATSTGDVATVFTVVATGGGLQYQWYRDSVAIGGATGASYSTSTAGSYDVVVRNTLGQVRSSAAVLTISTDPVIKVQPASASITAGRSTRLSVVATGAGLSYQWFKGGIAIGGATGSSYTASAADSYTVVVSSSRAGAKSVTSATATVSVSATTIAPTLTTQPVAATVTAGAPVAFSVTAGGTDLAYAWYRNGVAIASATAPTYALDAAAVVDAGTYYVVVSNTAGFVSSTQVALTVLPVGSGSNTAAVLSAANAFLDTLSTTQKSAALSSTSSGTVLFGATLENARAWTSLPGPRHGLRLNSLSLSVTQLAAADRLISAALSSAGATQVSEIRLADDVYALRSGVVTGVGSTAIVGATQYSIAFIGTPSATTPWILQLTGHHLAHHISYNAPQVSATPMFIGSEPPNWTVNSAGATTIDNTATSNGTPHAPLETQRVAVSALATALQGSTASASAARLGSAPADLLAAPTGTTDNAFRSVAFPTGATGRGMLYTSMSDAQKEAVKAAVQAWVRTQATDVAQTLLDAYLSDAALAATYVGYGAGAGGRADFGEYPNANALPASAANSYLRIDGPRVWIEFVVRQSDVGVGASVFYRSIWRDKVADYGGQF